MEARRVPVLKLVDVALVIVPLVEVRLVKAAERAVKREVKRERKIEKEKAREILLN